MKGIAVVLEALYDHGNRSAVYRTAEANGLLNVHVIKPEAAMKRHARDVSRGAEKWLRIYEHSETEEAIGFLQRRGYRVLVAHMHGATDLHSVDFSQPTALLFGNEKAGVSDAAHAAADGAFFIPMAGMTESLNVSVAASTALHIARTKRERALGAMTDLSLEEREILLGDYIQRSVGRELDAGLTGHPMFPVPLSGADCEIEPIAV